jgi:hypothetical protein
MAANTRATTGLILALDARFAIAAIGHPCPLYPRKRTNYRQLGVSALCQKRTNALQQTPLFGRFDPSLKTSGFMRVLRT